VAETIERFKQAGMQVWMLTGDKVETACCIAVSAGFKSRS
jgi:phospholipid-translocating ATPase